MPFSPQCNPDLTVGLRRATLADILERQNWFSSVHYHQTTDEGTVVTERSFPMGELRLRTVVMMLDYWDIYLDEGMTNVAPLTQNNVEKLLTPREFNEIYEEILRVNPDWGGDSGESGESDSTE